MSEQERNNNKDRQAEILAGIEAGLARRVQSGTELPWLEVSVMSQIEARERAREWLRSNGSLFRHNAGMGKGLRPGPVITQLVQDLGGMARNTRFWSTIGAMAGGGGLGYILAIRLAAVEASGTAGVATILALCGMFVAGVAVQWPYLREYYS